MQAYRRRLGRIRIRMGKPRVRASLGRVALAGLFLWTGAASLAGAEIELKPEVDALVRPLVDDGTVVGLAVGLLRGDQTCVFGYGTVSKTAEEAPDGKTVFEIGSVTKVFTALLLADMARHKLVGLDDPIHKHLPDSAISSPPDERPITLVDLATHTSGLPRLPDNLLVPGVVDARNPYAHYTADHLYAFLAKRSLVRPADAPVSYSNLGMGLLGHLLARRAGTSYENLVVQRICSPLGMNDTRIELSDELRARLAQGHNFAGKPASNWDIPTLAGCGALRSTADDMLLFLAAQVGLTKTPLEAAMQATQRPRHSLGNSGGSIALGWHIRPDGNVLWHNGQTGGYHSFVAFQKERRIGVVLLSNSAVGAVDPLGNRLIDVLAGKKEDP
jgi:D-alanyl-D-alanine-carboxypeptidase/D-alanyl-D-alanine-endopeptidase